MACMIPQQVLLCKYLQLKPVYVTSLYGYEGLQTCLLR
jgi:hypothetical protein